MAVSKSRVTLATAGAIGGYAPLDSGLLVPLAYIPASTFIKTLLDDADAATARATLGIGVPATAAVATAETRSSATPADLTTTGPSVTVTVGASGIVKVSVRCRIQTNFINGYGFAGVVISGANTVAFTTYLLFMSATSNQFAEATGSKLLTGLTPGSTTFKVQYGGDGTNTSTFTNREIIVEPL